MFDRRRVLIFGVILIIFAAALACDTATFTAFLDAGTATPRTRAPRATFTPRATATLEDTPTPDISPTLESSPTLAPRATSRPVTKAPPPPTAVPKPVFEWKQRPDLSIQGLCEQANVWEVKGRIHDGHEYVGGVHIVAIDRNGKVAAQMDSKFKETMNLEWGVNCRESSSLFSYQLDIAASRMNGPITLHLTRSSSDMTPISTDIKFDIGPTISGRWYFDWTK